MFDHLEEEERQEYAQNRRERARNRAARRPELGSWHTITERAVKMRDDRKVTWQSEPIQDLDARIKKTGGLGRHGEWIPDPPITEYRAMFIGYRFKFNGEWGWTRGDEDGESEEYFSQKETVEVWLFVTHANRKPVEVFPFDYPEDEDQ